MLEYILYNFAVNGGKENPSYTRPEFVTFPEEYGKNFADNGFKKALAT